MPVPRRAPVVPCQPAHLVAFSVCVCAGKGARALTKVGVRVKVVVCTGEVVQAGPRHRRRRATTRRGGAGSIHGHALTSLASARGPPHTPRLSAPPGQRHTRAETNEPSSKATWRVVSNYQVARTSQWRLPNTHERSALLPIPPLRLWSPIYSAPLGTGAPVSSLSGYVLPSRRPTSAGSTASPPSRSPFSGT
jgi:hypothetical protein